MGLVQATLPAARVSAPNADAFRTGLVEFHSRSSVTTFESQIDTIQANAIEDIPDLIEAVRNYVASGCHAAGFIAYEAAAAFDSALVTHTPAGMPLAWFGIYERKISVNRTAAAIDNVPVPTWTASVQRRDYEETIRTIRRYLAAGDTYQVNYTFPLSAQFDGDAYQLFYALFAAQPTDHAAFLDAGDFQLLSFSPELFFRLDGGHITTRPMKGTRPRGLWPDRDAALARELATSEKDRAENMMIVDMVRNDLGRICETGSIHVESLFDVERYNTVWQMTSAISGKTGADVPEIFRALFPSASVTGAPKVRTMEIIRELESAPRGAYCGSIGWWSPDRRAEFNVAIRTITLNATTGRAVYPVGSGVTWDSSAQAEYDECIAKAVAVQRPRPEFQLLESLLFDGEYFLLEEHLDRLQASAHYFAFAFDRVLVRRALMAHVSCRTNSPRKIRLLLASDGQVSVESETAPEASPLRVRLASSPVDSRDVFLYHKTTHRTIYADAMRDMGDCDDVLLWNERGELTESTRANLVVELDGDRLTPSIECGLLAGVMRRHLLESDAIRETILPVDVLQHASRIWLVNSVRRWIHVEVVSSG